MTIVVKRNKWKIWSDVIFSLFVREIRTGFNDKLGISWAVINPIVFIFVLSFIRGRISGSDIHTIPTFVFMAYGMLLIQTFLQTLSSCSMSIKKAKPLFAFRQVQPISAVLATAIFELLVKLGVILGIYLVMYLLRMDIRIDDPLMLIFNAILLWWISVMVGLVFGIVTLYVPEINKLLNMLTRPLFFISGVFFSLQDIPREFWHYLDWNPILHVIELGRHAAYNSYSSEGVSQSYVVEVVLVGTFFAFACYQSFWKQAISR